MSSATGIEVIAAEKWLYDTLSTDSVLKTLLPLTVNSATNYIADRVYVRKASASGQRPYIIIQNLSATDLNAVGADRVWSDGLYLVKVIGNGNNAQPLLPVVQRIDAILHDADPQTLPLGTLQACVREQSFQLLEPAGNGTDYLHLGGIYRIYVQ